MKNRLFVIVKIMVSVGLVALIFYRVDMNSFFNALKETDIYLFMAGVFFSIASVFLRAYKWQLLLNPHGKKFSVCSLSSISFISLFFNNFFLGSLGGDIYKIYITGNQSLSRSGPASSIIMDRITGVLVLALTASVSGVVIYLEGGSFVSGRDVNVLLAACFAVFVLIYAGFKIMFRVRNLRIIKKFQRIDTITDRIATSIQLYERHPKAVFSSIILGFICILLTSLALYAYSHAAHIDINFMSWLFINPIVSFLTMVPISVNGLGVQEGVFIIYLTRLGIDPASSLLIAMLPRIEIIILSIIGGILYIFWNGNLPKAVTDSTGQSS